MDQTSGMVQQLCTNPQIQWKSQAMPGPSKGQIEALIRLVYRGPRLNDILPELTNAQYLSLIDVSFAYHNLKLDENSSYLTTVACQFGRYRYKRLSFGAAHAGDMFQRNSR